MKVFIAIAALCCMAVALPARNKTKIKIKIKIKTSRLQTTLPPMEIGTPGFGFMVFGYMVFLPAAKPAGQ